MSTQLNSSLENYGQDEFFNSLEPLNTPKKVEEVLGVPVSTLAYWRFEGTHLPFVKMGRMVRYRKQDIIDFVNNNVHTSTSEVNA
jgi:hypothetical protein